MAKAIFLDRDGVINKERGQYTYLINDFVILPKVKKALSYLKSLNFALIINPLDGTLRFAYSRARL